MEKQSAASVYDDFDCEGLGIGSSRNFVLSLELKM